MEKKCITCKNIKHIDFFTNDKNKKDGKNSMCKSCRKEQRERLTALYSVNKIHTTQKECSVCNITKSMQDFSNTKSAKDGKCSYCKSCKRQIDKKYYNDNFDKVADYHKQRWRTNENAKIQNKKAVEKKRFGLNATELVKDKSCQHCGITNDEHFKKWNERLHIDHINNDGRYNQRLGLKPNNDMSNLQILCRSCHVRKDNKTKDYSKKSIFTKEQIEQIIDMGKQGKSARNIATEFNYKYGTIYAIIKGKNLQRFNLSQNENN